MKILVPQPVILDGIQSLIDQGAEIVRCRNTEADISAAITDVDAVLARNEEYSRKVLEKAKNLKIIARYGVGYDKVDIAAADELGIWVANTPEALSNSVAEHVMLLILATARHFHMSDEHMRSGDFAIRNALGMELAGKTIGLVGFGRIARDVAAMCHLGFHMHVLAANPNRALHNLPPFVAEDEMYHMLGRCDIVSLHLPLADNTAKLADERFFASMKEGSIFINAARGGEVDENALIEVLESKKLFGAGLDCFSAEPLPLTSPLYRFENVVMSPHNASATTDSFTHCSMDMGDNVKDVLVRKVRPRHAVNNPPHPRQGE